MAPSFRGAAVAALVACGCATGQPMGDPACTEAPDPPVVLRASPEGPRGLWLEPIDDPVELTIDAPATGAPRLAWDGRSWHLAWGTRHAVLDDTATLVDAVETRSQGGDVTALEPGACRSAVLAPADVPGQSVLAWVDPRGTELGLERVAGIDADVSRRDAHWWIATDVSRPGSPALAIYALDHDRIETRARIVAGAIASARIVATSTGAAVAWADREGIVQRALDHDGTEQRALRVMSANVWSRGALESVLLRGPGDAERIAIAATDGAVVHLAITDARSSAVLAGPLAVARTTVRNVSPGLAAIPERGLLALCHPAGPGPWGGPDVIDRVELVLIGQDASPATHAVEVGRGGEVRSVACGWNGRELLVVWSRAEGSAEQLVMRRIRVQDEPRLLLRAPARPL